MNLRPSGYEPDELPTAPSRDIKYSLLDYYIPIFICKDTSLQLYLSNNINGDFYFVIKDKNLTNSYSCRISMKESKYLKSDFILTKDQKDSFIRDLNDKSKDWWSKFIDFLNDEREIEELPLIAKDLPMPDYTLLL